MFAEILYLFIRSTNRATAGLSRNSVSSASSMSINGSIGFSGSPMSILMALASRHSDSFIVAGSRRSSAVKLPASASSTMFPARMACRSLSVMSPDVIA